MAGSLKGHRPSGATLKRGPRVRIQVTPSISKETTLDLCGRCYEVVRFDHSRGAFGLWVHGLPEGTIEYLKENKA